MDEIAAKITVRIETENNNGSGVIIAQKKNLLFGTTYYVATATHVVPRKAKYKVVTPDGKRYPVDYGKVKSFPRVDLAVLQFSSPETYPVATLAEYKLEADERQWVFLSGWPGVQPGNSFQREFTAGLAFSEARGSVVVKEAASLANGYELVYTNWSKGGMSGGPVLDTQGRVIGIHAAIEADMLGYSLGVPIRTLVGLASQAGIEPEWLKVETAAPKELTEDVKKPNNYFVNKGILNVKKRGNFSNYLANSWATSLCFSLRLKWFNSLFFLPQRHKGHEG